MPAAHEQVLYAVDLAGTASFALSGALRALDRKPDVVGMLILASSAAVGGGVFRDLVLRREILFLRDGMYPLMVVLAVAAVCVFPKWILRREKMFQYFDAVGLGVFTAFTAQLTHRAGVNPLSVLFVATFAGCIGGIARDLMMGKETLVMSNQVYVTPAIFGAAALILLDRFANLPGSGFWAAMAITTLIRCCAIRWDWRLPRLFDVPRATRQPKGL